MSTLGFGIWIWVDMCPHDVIRWQVTTMTSSWCQIILVPLLPLVKSSLYDLRNNECIDAMDNILDCVFAPYFCSDEGAAHFAAIHKIFGVSNVSKLLLHLRIPDRCEAVVTISYEAQARLQDPVYGCVTHIFALQQQVY